MSNDFIAIAAFLKHANHSSELAMSTLKALRDGYLLFFILKDVCRFFRHCSESALTDLVVRETLKRRINMLSAARPGVFLALITGNS